MSRDADFSQAMKTLLAKRAGNHCSFPGCYRPTDGPSDESASSSASTGMACHIVAASDGPAARRVKALSPKQLKDISNGVWMCYTHGKLIDADECEYTIPVLESWKEIAELRAKLAQKYGWSKEFDPTLFSSLKFPEITARLPGLENLNQIIGEAVHECCASVLWGRAQADATRDAATEIGRNAFEHGQASEVRIEITPRSVKILDDGAAFDSSRLGSASGKSGGTRATTHLLTAFQHSLFFSSRREDGWNINEIAIVRSSDEVKDLTPCTVEVGFDALREKDVRLQVVDGCETVYVIFPPFFALSDVIRLPRLVASQLPKGKTYVFVSEGLSAHALEVLTEILPDIRVINFEYDPARV